MLSICKLLSVKLLPQSPPLPPSILQLSKAWNVSSSITTCLHSCVFQLFISTQVWWNLMCIPTTQTLQVYFLLFHEHNYSDCVFTLNTVPEHILCRHRWRNEAAAAAALLTCCFHHTASVCVDSLTSCCKAYDHWCSLSLSAICWSLVPSHAMLQECLFPVGRQVFKTSPLTLWFTMSSRFG